MPCRSWGKKDRKKNLRNGERKDGRSSSKKKPKSNQSPWWNFLPAARCLALVWPRLLTLFLLLQLPILAFTRPFCSIPTISLPPAKHLTPWFKECRAAFPEPQQDKKGLRLITAPSHGLDRLGGVPKRVKTRFSCACLSWYSTGPSSTHFLSFFFFFLPLSFFFFCPGCWTLLTALLVHQSPEKSQSHQPLLPRLVIKLAQYTSLI